jgi:hypothetical protein
MRTSTKFLTKYQAKANLPSEGAKALQETESKAARRRVKRTMVVYLAYVLL